MRSGALAGGPQADMSEGAGAVWHRTSAEELALAAIEADGAAVPPPDEQAPARSAIRARAHADLEKRGNGMTTA